MIVVDRIENGRAILEIQGETIDVDMSALPSGTEEGAILAFTLCDDQEAQMQRDNEERLRRLREQDPGDMEIDL